MHDRPNQSDASECTATSDSSSHPAPIQSKDATASTPPQQSPQDAQAAELSQEAEDFGRLGPRLSLSELWKTPPNLEMRKTPMEAWLRHSGMMVTLYSLVSIPMGFLTQGLQMMFFLWVFVGIAVGVQVVHRRVRRHVPLVVDTFPRALKFFVMIVMWPALLK